MDQIVLTWYGWLSTLTQGVAFPLQDLTDRIEVPLFTAVIFGLIGALAGLILTPYITTRPVRAFRSTLGRLSAETLFAGLAGLVIGLLVAALLAFPLSLLPRPFGSMLPFVGVIVFAYLSISLFIMRQGDLMSLLSALGGRGESGGSSSWTNLNRTILLDTSVIIDGRVADIAKTGFLPGTLLIPRFVLNELQYIADSPDGLRRQRGRVMQNARRDYGQEFWFRPGESTPQRSPDLGAALGE